MHVFATNAYCLMFCSLCCAREDGWGARGGGCFVAPIEVLYRHGDHPITRVFVTHIANGTLTYDG